MSVAEKVIPWQLRKGRNTNQKLEQVLAHAKALGVKSAIDIGCNAGLITRGLGEQGIFAVGIEQELNFDGVDNALKGACLGEIRFDHDVAASLPKFDAATVLSVHHHFVREMGDARAAELIALLGDRVNKLIIFEVSSKSQEYGQEPNGLFRDGDEESVVTYTVRWLQSALPGWDIKYVWKNARRPRLSDRYMFTCIKPV